MSTLRREKTTQDSTSETNVEVLDAPSSPAVVNSGPKTCNKIMNTDESYLMDLAVKIFFIFIIVHYNHTFTFLFLEVSFSTSDSSNSVVSTYYARETTGSIFQ